MNSTFGKLNFLDVLKGFIMAVGGALIAALNNILVLGQPLQFTWAFWQPIVWSAIGVGLVYLLKNVFQNSGGVPFKAESNGTGN